MQNEKLKNGSYSVKGWWQYPDTETHVFVRDRGEAFVDTDIRHEFSGFLSFDDAGIIDEKRSEIKDKDGPYAVRSGDGLKKRGRLDFFLYRQSQVDDIIFVLQHDHETDSWHGSFEGDMIGEGIVELVLRKLPDIFPQ